MEYEQLDIFSFMQSPIQETPILLHGGQEVFLVNKGEIIKCMVCDNVKSWICGENNRSYRLVKEKGFDVTWNDRILGEQAFTN